MHRTLATLVALATLAAGCIAVPEESDAATLQPADAPPAEERIQGMTAEVTQTDAAVDCKDSGLTIPPGFCAERVVVATGRIGLDTLPVELIGTNGPIELRRSDGDAWSFTATVRVRAVTEDLARAALDTAWSWSHEDADGSHALRAKPAAAGSLGWLSASVRYVEYKVALPEWLVLELTASTDNGGIHVARMAMGDADLETDNGEIIVSGTAHNVRARTDNGQIIASLRPAASGVIDLATDNGQIILEVPEGRAFGYDVAGKTDNGQVIIGLRDGDVRKTEDGATFRTRGYDGRAIQTKVALETDNGQAIVSPL
ncbi:MAG TPA: hypothetical protein VFH78_13150 [Candidatus Thermoplasmatota archaeon]|nr:hypothetical protein [Candidatus Thermoplasmatota archaeon]